MATNHLTPFETFRAALGIESVRDYLTSRDELRQLTVEFETTEEPHNETLKITIRRPRPRLVPRLTIPLITQTELNGRVWVMTQLGDTVIQATTLSALAQRLEHLGVFTGFTPAVLILLRQVGGDETYRGYYVRQEVLVG